jgi:exo-rhamnogalacturonan lyase-like protein
MRGFVAAVGLVALTAACGTAFAGEVERLALWPEMEDWLEGEGQGYIVPAVETTDWVGFINEGNRVRGLDTGDSFRYVFDREGTYYLGVVMTDDSDGVERLKVTFNQREIGTMVCADDNGKALYSFSEPVTAKKGDALDFTCMVPVGCYRIYDLAFAKRPILPPQPSFEYFETWCARPGDVDICWTTSGIVGTGRVEYKAKNDWQKSAPSKAEGRNHRIRLGGLDSTAAYTGRIVTMWQGKELASKPFTFRAAPRKLAPTKTQSIALVVPEPTDAPRRAWPTTIGMPFSRGTLADAADLSLLDPKGKAVPLQAAATSHWDDGSIKWVTTSFLANSATAGSYRLEAKSGIATRSGDASPVLAVVESTKGWGLSTGALSFTIAKTGAAFFGRYGFDRNQDGVITSAEVTTGSGASGLVLETGDGQVLTCAAPTTVEIKENGPVRAVVECAGAMQGERGGQGWDYLVRLTFWKGMPGMAANVTLWNGDQKPLFRKVRQVSVNIPVAGGAGLRGGFQGEALANVPDGTTMRLFQDTDAHYAQYLGAAVTEGERAQGLVTVNDGAGAVSLLCRDFWETYPSALELDATGLRLDLLPALVPDAYTVENAEGWFHRLYQWFDEGCYLMRAGQTTQHEFFLWFDADEKAASRQTAWLSAPLLPQASPEYLCSTGVLGGGVFPKEPGVWDAYESFFDGGFAALVKDREAQRMHGWMNFGDWYGERGLNAGNNEYDLAWCLGMQWMRTGDRHYFEPGLEMARHYSTVDTIRGEWTENVPGVVWEHSFNHVGTRRTPEALGFDEHGMNYAKNYPGTFEGAVEPQGHIFEDGVWLYGLLTGDTFLLDTAERVCTRQADFLTPTFDFEIERGGGWPLINATGAYMFTGDPYYLNAARIMVQRCLERHDPEHGGWPHVPPINETLDVPVVGGKAFATGILTFGLLRYLDVEPMDRPEVKQMLLNTADWLMHESWEPGNGFKYITNSPKHVGKGHRGHECLMNADVIGYAYEATGDKKYLTFWEEMMAGAFDGSLTGWGKGFSQGTRQTIFGISRARKAGITACKPLEKK